MLVAARRVTTMATRPPAVARPQRQRLAVLAAVSLLGSACSGDGLPEQEAGDEPACYAEVAAFTADLDAENTAADGELNDALATTPPRAVGDLFATVTAESADRLDERLAELEALSPPAAAGTHATLVASSSALAEQSRAYADLLVGVHADDLGAVTPPTSFTEAEAAVDDVCADLQDLTDTAGADVDLCVGLFAPPR